jgi:hypothetical protein
MRRNLPESLGLMDALPDYHARKAAGIGDGKGRDGPSSK